MELRRPHAVQFPPLHFICSRTPEMRQRHCLPPPGVGNCFITEFLESEARKKKKKKAVLQPDVTDVGVWGPRIKKLAWRWKRWQQSCFCFVSPWCVSPFPFQFHLPAADVQPRASRSGRIALWTWRCCAPTVLLARCVCCLEFIGECRSIVMKKHNKRDLIRLLRS